MTSRADAPAYRIDQETKGLHGRIVRDLGLRIVSGELKPGEKLPHETTLIETYEVSRPVLREAVRVLTAKGLVVSRQRSGATVRPRNEWHLLDPDVLYWMIQTKPEAEFVSTLMAVRRVFEPGAAALAARVATPAQLQSIEAAYEGMAKARTTDELLEPDLAFHRRIAEATGNDLLAYIGNMLSLALRESIKLSSRLPNTHALSLPRHKAILTALQNHDALAAQQATLVQLEETIQDISAVIAPGIPMN
ncbi:FadR/GntR family transcriptional regulator [Ideonella sp.]|uniref:FadR/GntR family transcriptional regulator n=1 Tax=Ideonella sp. TaxID=1929293 RepID=UPI002B46F74F|nr:FadR/GntR family transcriptional regulator [Ideonella sp.]HJV69667.1 FadR/GntR family transcriptional regulator [Ideonella sp.]